MVSCVQTKVCRRGANCPYSHNLFEYFLVSSSTKKGGKLHERL